MSAFVSLPVIARDAVVLGLLAVGSAVLAFAGNQLRATPLSGRYAPPAERLRLSAASYAPAEAVPKAAVRTIFPDELREMLAGSAPLILDARPEPFHRRGHIVNALSLPRADFAAAYERYRSQLEASKAQPVVIYCQGGDCEDSELLAEALAGLGYTQLFVLAGGWEQWQDASLNPQEARE